MHNIKQLYSKHFGRAVVYTLLSLFLCMAGAGKAAAASNLVCKPYSEIVNTTYTNTGTEVTLRLWMYNFAGGTSHYGSQTIDLVIDGASTLYLQHVWPDINTNDKQKLLDQATKGNIGTATNLKFLGGEIGTLQLCNLQNYQNCKNDPNTLTSNQWSTIDLKFSFNELFNYSGHTIGVNGSWYDNSNNTIALETVKLKNIICGFVYPSDLKADFSDDNNVVFSWKKNSQYESASTNGRWIVYRIYNQEGNKNYEQIGESPANTLSLSVDKKKFSCNAQYTVSFIPSVCDGEKPINGLYPLFTYDSENHEPNANDVCQKCGHSFFRYHTTDGNLVRIGYKKDFGANIVAHSVINGECVIEFDGQITQIPENPFIGKNKLTGDLRIPNSVTKIGDNAFSGGKFNGTLTLPSNLKIIEKSAFQGCSGFNGTLTLPNSVTSIGMYAFQGCSGFNGTLTLPNSVTSIGNFAFQGCSGFTNLKLSEALSEISNGAFYDCISLSGDLVIPNSVTKIDRYAFGNCYGFDGTLTLSDKLKTIEYNAFEYCTGFRGSLILPNSVTTIGESAFRECSGFTSLKLSESLSSIPIYAFYNCRNLANELVIPASVKEIKQYAFHQCINLNKNSETPSQVTLPKTLKYFGLGVFVACNNIKTIKFQSLPEGISGDLGGQTKTVSLSDNSYISDMARGTVNEISYTRVMTSNWGTLVLPYPLKLTGEEPYRLYSIDNMTGEELVLKQLEGVVDAGTACVVKRNGSEAELTFGANKAALNMAIGAKNVDGMTFSGTYWTKEVNSGYVISKNSFWNVEELKNSSSVKGVKVNPFRAWLDGTSANAPAQLSMRIDGSTTGIDAIDALNDAEAEYYDLSGKRLDEPQRGVNIVRMKSGKTKKIIIK